MASPRNFANVGPGLVQPLRYSLSSSSTDLKSFPHVDDLNSRASEEISQFTQFTSVDSLLDNIQQCNHRVPNDISFKRPDRAYIEWLKSDKLLVLMTQHSEFPYLKSARKEKYLLSRKEHEAQRSMCLEIRKVVEADNQRSGVHSRSESRGSVSVQSPRDKYSQQLRSTSIVEGNNAIHGRPPSQPVEAARSVRHDQVPSSLLPAGSSNSFSSTLRDPFIERFAQLRTSGTSGRLPYPTDDQGLKDLSSITRGVTNTEKFPELYQGQSTPERRDSRPVGPRDMPTGASYVPSPSLNTSLAPKIVTNLPRAPSPVYSPTRNIPAPSSIQPPRSTIRSASGAANALRLKKPIPRSTTIKAEELFNLLKSDYDVLVIDVRPRELFDDGHINAKSIVCIDPLGIQYGMSSDELIESLVLSPDAELDMLKYIDRFDLVVYYNESTVTDQFLQGVPKNSNAPPLRALFDTLVQFNDTRNLKTIPQMLSGGLDSWIDLVGRHALQPSHTLGMPTSGQMRRPPARPTRRVSIANGNSSYEIRRRRLLAHIPLNSEEEKEWQETARREQVAPTDIRQFQSESNGDDLSVINNGPDVIHTYDDFFRKFPPVEQQSMVTPRPAPQRPPPLPPAPPRAPPPIPSVPSRPAPAVSRPSYGGVSDHNGAQPSNASRQQHLTQPPLYTSRFVSQNLKLPRTGLRNFGVTCYMNATVQCLLATIPLSRFFLDDTWRNFVQKNPRGSEGILPEIFASLIRGLWRNSDPVLRPVSLRRFCARLREDWGQDVQQDAKEFFEFLIDTLHEDLNAHHQRTLLRDLTPNEEYNREKMPIGKASKIEWDRWSHREYSFITTLFAGQHASQLRCQTCNSTSTKYEPFNSISVEIPQESSYPASITDCLRNYCKQEQLDSGEEWRCTQCKCLRQATKQIRITRLPQILVVHFKRFSTMRDSAARKLHTIVDFPLHGLDMTPFMSDTRMQPPNGEVPDAAVTPPFLYDAYGVMRHLGTSLGGGHYTAIVRDSARNIWVEFNDDRVTDFDPAKRPAKDRLQNSQAYIVFYERARAR